MLPILNRRRELFSYWKREVENGSVHTVLPHRNKI